MLQYKGDQMEKEAAFLGDNNIEKQREVVLKGVKGGIDFMYLQLQTTRDKASNSK